MAPSLDGLKSCDMLGVMLWTEACLSLFMSSNRGHPNQYGNHLHATSFWYKIHNLIWLRELLLHYILEGPDRDAIMQAAASFPDLVNKPAVIEAVQLQPQCDLRRCSVTAGGLPVHLILQSELHNGFNVCIRMASALGLEQRPLQPGSAPDHIDHFDDVVFMQRSRSTPVIASSSSAPGTNCPEPFVFNPNAHIFVPGHIPIEGMDEFTQDLHRIWLEESFSWEGETPTCLFTTWMVDHSGAFRHCTRPRDIRLGPDFAAWETQIRRDWADELVGNPSLEYHIVSPTPPRLERQALVTSLLFSMQMKHLSRAWSQSLTGRCVGKMEEFNEWQSPLRSTSFLTPFWT